MGGAIDVGVIVQKLLVRGDRGAKRLPVVFDSGASRSLVRSSVAVELAMPRRLLVPREFTVTDGDRVVCELFCELAVELGGEGGGD